MGIPSIRWRTCVDKNKKCLQFPSISIKLISSFLFLRFILFSYLLCGYWMNSIILILWILNVFSSSFLVPAKQMWPVMNSHPTISPVNKNDWRAVNLLKLELVTTLNSPFLLLLNPVLPILQRVKYLSCLFHNAEQ